MPPEAITGTGWSTRASRAVASTFGPTPVPSRVMSVYKIAAAQERLGVPDAAHPASDREGNVQLQRHALDEPHQRAARLQGRADVEEAELVRARGSVGARLLDGIAGVAQLLEAHALHHAPVLHVEAGDDPARQHDPSSAAWA